MSKDHDDEGLGNLFKIIDGIVDQLHLTKRMFIIMILTVMILPPVALFIASVYLEPPFGGGWPGGYGRPPPPGPQDPFFTFLKQLPLIISVVWLGVGIYQWYVLSKWTKRYQRYKERQRRAEEKLGDNDNGNPEESGK
ncbi:MAG TPA: hypothetical protein VGQ03_03165 [Nitrososphaera sp.]|jgi:hypothetical protein|nr:hypothetical protein [Nitrososphaera sp.]